MDRPYKDMVIICWNHQQSDTEVVNSPMGVAFVVAAAPSVGESADPDPKVEDFDGAPVKGALLTGKECRIVWVVAMAAVACVG